MEQLRVDRGKPFRPGHAGAVENILGDGDHHRRLPRLVHLGTQTVAHRTLGQDVGKGDMGEGVGRLKHQARDQVGLRTLLVSSPRDFFDAHIGHWRWGSGFSDLKPVSHFGRKQEQSAIPLWGEWKTICKLQPAKNNNYRNYNFSHK